MSSRAGVVAACSALLGALLGYSFGWPWAWAATQGLLAAQMTILMRCERRSAAQSAGLFASAMVLAGSIGFAADVPETYRTLVWLPLLAWAGLQGLLAAACAWLSCTMFRSVASRWLLAWPALWCVHECLLAQSRFAMPWLRLGQLQAGDGLFAGALPAGGSLLAGICMWLCAALMALAFAERAWRLRTFAGVAALSIGCLAAENFEWTHDAGPIDALLLQEGPPSEQTLPARLERYLQVGAEARSSLIISAQLALPKVAAALPAGYLLRLQRTLQRSDSDMLLGMYMDAGEGRLHNGVQSLGTSGMQQYLKRQLFPFGEFLPVPLPIRAWLDTLMPAPLQDTLAGPKEASEIWLGGRRVAVMACFELAFASLWREEAANADLLINISSDSSHPNAQQLRQFRQMAQARAMEFQKPLLRSTDIGGSLALNHRGQVLALGPEQQASQLPVRVQARQGLTPFARLGDTLALGLAALMLAAAFMPVAFAQEPRRHRFAALWRAQSGQVLMAAVALLLMSAGLMYLMVNTGQIVTEKTRVTNAADAAAYSAGIVEARALNYDAYMNRAMVANEIVIAQLVSYASWLRYAATAIQNIPGTLGDISFYLQPDAQAAQLSAIFAGADYLIETYTGNSPTYYADAIIDYGIGPMIAAHDVAAQAMSTSQGLVHLNLMLGVRQGQIANDLVTQMDPDLHAQVLQPVAFDGFTKDYAKTERARLADVVTRSRDPFTRERNWSIESADIPLIRRDGALKKRGGTELIGYDEWRAVDTLELHGRRFGCGKFSLSWCDDVQTPIGWGAVNVNAGGGDAGRGYHGNAYDENSNTAGQADSEMREPGLTNFSGLPGSQELADLDPKADISTGISILVYKSHSTTLTSGGAAQAKPSGALALFNDKPAGGKLVALSRAQVFFDRISARADGKSELGSLYNPYWRVRLVAPTAADRAYAAGMQGGLALP